MFGICGLNLTELWITFLQTEAIAIDLSLFTDITTRDANQPSTF